MPKFDVLITYRVIEEETTTVEVEAEDEESAKEKAFDMACQGKVSNLDWDRHDIVEAEYITEVIGGLE